MAEADIEPEAIDGVISGTPVGGEPDPINEVAVDKLLAAEMTVEPDSGDEAL